MLCGFSSGALPKYLDRQARAYSTDQDQMHQNVASDQSLHCLPFNLDYLEATPGSQMDDQFFGEL